MSKIPTAEEFYKQTTGCVMNHKDIKIAMIDFAKLHVKAALKEANKKAEIHSDSGSNYYREFEEGIRNNTIWIPANSILNAYPLENIK